MTTEPGIITEINTEDKRREVLNNISRLLAAPFPEKDLEWRVGRSGVSNGKPWAMVLCYITSRAVMDRLDAVFGNWNWSDKYRETQGGKGYICTITANVMGVVIKKEDAADCTDIESIKGGISDSLKRTAVKFGIGRYLYKLTENFAECTTNRPAYGDKSWTRVVDKKTNTTFWWKAPTLPAEFLPQAPVAQKPTERVNTVTPKSNPKQEAGKPLDQKTEYEQLRMIMNARTNNRANKELVDVLKKKFKFSVFKDFETKTAQELRDIRLQVEQMTAQ